VFRKGEEAMNRELRISLAAARVNANLTQEEARKKIGVTKQTLCNWERGITHPSIEKAELISKIYGIPYQNIIFLP
jgi:DNA-binding XRE family transcriptional regulator